MALVTWTLPVVLLHHFVEVTSGVLLSLGVYLKEQFGELLLDSVGLGL